jgi:8-oxo-dGTP diphosphatase
MRASGDGFLLCSDGHTRWGRFGAAGALFVHRAGGGCRVLVQHRSAWSHEGGTWSVPGGALDAGESPEEGALREASEEIGTVPPYAIVGDYVFAPADDWTYTTIVVEVPGPFGEHASFETASLEWLTPDDVERLPLHAGFAAAWPHLRDVVDGWVRLSPPAG